MRDPARIGDRSAAVIGANPERSPQKRTAAYLYLHLAILLVSFSTVLAKLASRYPFFSTPFLAYLLLELLVLMVYAYFWQQTLKRFTLSTVYSNRAIATVWTFIVAVLFFHETPRFQDLVGIALVILGVRLVVSCDE